LYYDSHDQFPKAIMVDEFGGNYLDANYDYGLYKTVKDTFGRFLGTGETIEQRIKLQTQANVKVAEYWRRIGAAGYSPFCALGSHEDGSHWFEGDLKEGNPKPVWNALAVAYAPLSVSLNIWDQNFEGGQTIEVPVHFFNDTAEAVEMEVLLTIEEGDTHLFKQTARNTVQPYSSSVVDCEMTLPDMPGAYWIKATLLNKQPQVKHPVVSEWDICILDTCKSPQLEQIVLGIPDEERELAAFADQQGLQHVRPGQGRDHDLLLLSRESWNRITAQDEAFKKHIEASVTGGCPALLLDVGTQFLGQGYPENEGDLGPLQGAFRLTEQRKQTTHVFGSLSLVFGQAAEPESHMHAHPNNNALWKHLSEDDAWLWNGYRGGLIIPADVMEVIGLNQKSFFDLWVERGADPESLRSNPNYTAYELDGYYAFTQQPQVDQDAVIQGLRDHIQFIQQDAPAIAAYIDPGAPVEIHALNREYNKLSVDSGRQMMIEPLAVAGKGLSKVPVVKIHLGGGAGDVIASQLLTRGRLAKGFGSEGLYGVRYDPAAVQMVLNMIDYLSTKP
jgi:hypothetical protein